MRRLWLYWTFGLDGILYRISLKKILVWKYDSFGFFLFTTSLMIDVALYTRIATSSSPEGGV